MLRVPAHTRIASHSHRDDRVATVISGTWHFGYGDKFDEAKLKALSVGRLFEVITEGMEAPCMVNTSKPANGRAPKTYIVPPGQPLLRQVGKCNS